MKKIFGKIDLEKIQDKISSMHIWEGWILLGPFLLCLAWALWKFFLSPALFDKKAHTAVVVSEKKAVDIEMIGISKTESLEDSLRSISDQNMQAIDMLKKELKGDISGIKTEMENVKEAQVGISGNVSATNYLMAGDAKDQSQEDMLIQQDAYNKEDILPQKPKGSIFIYKASERVLAEKRPRLTFGAGKICSGFLLNGTRSSTSADASSNPNLVMIQITDFGNFPKEFMEDIDEATAFGEAIADISAELVYIRVYMINITKNDGKEYTVDAGKGSNLGYAICKKTGIVGSSGKVTDNSISIMRKAFIANGLSAVAEFFKNRGMVAGTTLQNGAVVTKIGAKDQVEGAMASGAAKSLEKLADFYIKKAESITPVIQIEAGHEVVVVFPQKLKFEPVDEESEDLMQNYKTSLSKEDEQNNFKGVLQ